MASNPFTSLIVELEGVFGVGLPPHARDMAARIIERHVSALPRDDGSAPCPRCDSTNTLRVYRPEVYEFANRCRDCGKGWG